MQRLEVSGAVLYIYIYTYVCVCVCVCVSLTDCFLAFHSTFHLCHNLTTVNSYHLFTTEIVSNPQSTYCCSYCMYITFKSYPCCLLPCSFHPLGTAHTHPAHRRSGSYLLRLRICLPILHNISLVPLHISQCFPNCFARGTLLAQNS
jgi:hypothetical protein